MKTSTEMKHFLFLVKTRKDRLASLSREQMQQHVANVRQFIESLISSGQIKVAQTVEMTGFALSGFQGRVSGRWIMGAEQIPSHGCDRRHGRLHGRAVAGARTRGAGAGHREDDRSKRLEKMGRRSGYRRLSEVQRRARGDARSSRRSTSVIRSAPAFCRRQPISLRPLKRQASNAS